jgi:hypothetical protein
MKLINILILCLAAVCSVQGSNCLSFTVGQGTGCSWMCNYCATNLGTSNYYFTDNVCTYESGAGCVGNPIAGRLYTCCAAAEESEPEVKKICLSIE